ncbi:MAG: lipopolysaccharide heptosyltransferase family protein [Bacteroidetes bacterium]|nr:MAG: lipopolysaccharide heptosyltransferase family protein [Bacteroidota bacterium]
MKFLFVRLSSIGDVVLTTPLVRALAARYPNAELHFLTKAPYVPLLKHHPLIKAVHTWPPAPELVAERWEGVVDLQKNLRTLPLRWRLRYRRFATFPKENLRKWLMVRGWGWWKLRHVVLRYGEALRPWGVRPEALGPLEVHVPSVVRKRVQAACAAAGLIPGKWIAVGLGGTYATKRWPIGYWVELLQRLGEPVALLGGGAERSDAEALAHQLSQPVLVAAGQFDLLETAALLAEASLLLSHDTGTAHLGAAMGTPTVVLWGNTVPEFGMEPWQVPHLNIEALHLSCRPCSKLGYAACPRGHHDCVRALTPAYVLAQVEAFLQSLPQQAQGL